MVDSRIRDSNLEAWIHESWNSPRRPKKCTYLSAFFFQKGSSFNQSLKQVVLKCDFLISKRHLDTFIIDFQVILFLCGQDSDSGSDSNLWSDSDSRFESQKKRIFDKLSFYFIQHNIDLILWYTQVKIYEV